MLERVHHVISNYVFLGDTILYGFVVNPHYINFPFVLIIIDGLWSTIECINLLIFLIRS